MSEARPLALVVQRYGDEIIGGAESLCRSIAEMFSAERPVEVLTSCAKDYMSWRNDYAAGVSTVNGVTVRRFPVDFERGQRFHEVFGEMLGGMNMLSYHRQKVLMRQVIGRSRPELQQEYLTLSGPYSTPLLEHLAAHHVDYELVVFFTYLYATTTYGSQRVPAAKTVLVPTAHDEAAIFVPAYRAMFARFPAYVFLTPEERGFIETTFAIGGAQRITAGMPVEIDGAPDPDRFRARHGIKGPFVLYAGRLDPSKGCDVLFRLFKAAGRHLPRDVRLVLIGSRAMPIPRDPRIVYLGMLSDQDKLDAMAAADVMINPSPFESFSIVILEAMLCGTPVLVNGQCDVLRGHILRSSGGLHYSNGYEFVEALRLLLADEGLRDRMGRNGAEYVRRNYAREVVRERYRAFFEERARVSGVGGQGSAIGGPSAVDDLAARIAVAQSADFYDEAYFDAPKDVVSESGYAGYTAHEPGIDAGVQIITTHFHAKRVLDVGCAKGFVVEKLRQRGLDAWGIDFSRYAIDHASPRVRPYVAVGDVTAIRHAANAFDLVACNETLEHLTVERVPQAVAELHRVTSDKVWITTPSMGVNDFGPPDGWPQGKIAEASLGRYVANRDCPDPALPEDLMLDKNGYPIHGHLVMASYRWWTEMFTRQGFVRCGDIEARMNRAEAILAQGQWNSYVFEKPKAAAATPEHLAAQQAAVARLLTQPAARKVGTVADAAWSGSARVYRGEAGGPAGDLLHIGSGLLPAGRYRVEFEIAAESCERLDNPWAELAVLDVRSTRGMRIHALHTLRARDFPAAGPQRFALTFASGGEGDFELRVLVSGAGTMAVGARVVLDAAGAPPVETGV